MNPVAARIQSLLDERGEKLKPVAEKLGLTYYSVYPWWQRETAKADLEKVRAFAMYFGVPEGHLAYGDPITAGPDAASQLVQKIESLPDDDKKALESYLEHLLSKQDH